MPNSIDANGLQIASAAEILNELINGSTGFPGFAQIFPGANLQPNSPDANLLNIFTQVVIDVQEFLQAIYDSMDPDQAIGVSLDARCAINGVQRIAGTYTQQPINVTATGIVTLQGLDLYPTNPFTIQDTAGNQYQLLATYTFAGAGTQALVFQAAKLGAIQSTIGSITQIVTVVAGITTVNNAVAPSSIGQAEETDAQLRVRRAASVTIPSQGYYQGLAAALLAITGVTSAKVVENNTSGTVGGVPANSIWVIVTCANTTANINAVANAIYLKRSFGCGMRGTQFVSYMQPNGNTIVIYFDFSTPQNLYFRATLAQIDPSGAVLNKPAIQAAVLAQFGAAYGIGQSADSSSIAAFIKSIAPNAAISAEGVSADGISWTTLLAPTAVNYQFGIPDLAHVTIS